MFCFWVEGSGGILWTLKVVVVPRVAVDRNNALKRVASLDYRILSVDQSSLDSLTFHFLQRSLCFVVFGNNIDFES